ncbi:sulfite exporter TauE/SafE family protein [Lacticaseibacillus brantae]|uniref:Probable membrane transporter protein n=1 Tax=Lacticaseibacillus brantae DSM 23927 TaxID=1423727 RepID=A0A0R2AXX5_9LACO|nr:sulfite exporter TauE/SafE family protein [Lacticaseibacillus brantae]KRM72189.1 hypothetical protein FC34_GL001173 [Lacticaseibacillus brantae DSM 23927]
MKTVVGILFGLIGLMTISYLWVLGKDLMRHRPEMQAEPANRRLLPLTAMLIFFLSTFGASDFAISTAIYTRLKWVDIRNLPGTVNAQCVIPLVVMAVAYISRIQMSWWLLTLCIAAQVLGAFVGPRLVMRLPDALIRRVVGIGLLISALLLFSGQVHWLHTTGTATSLSPAKTGLLATLLFIYGALNNVGIGSFAPTLITVSLMGLSPLLAFPIMMGAAVFSIPVGSMVFIKAGQYNRSVVAWTSIFGVVGVLVAIFIVGQLQLTVINWIILVVLLYAAYLLIKPATTKKANPSA